jgi:hypothetical protein
MSETELDNLKTSTLYYRVKPAVRSCPRIAALALTSTEPAAPPPEPNRICSLPEQLLRRRRRKSPASLFPRPRFFLLLRSSGRPDPARVNGSIYRGGAGGGEKWG